MRNGLIIKIALLLSFLYLGQLTGQLKGQEKANDIDTTIQIITIEVLASHLPISSKKNVDVARLFQRQSKLYLRQYSNGSIGSIALNGTNPQQNQVFWNGIGLNSAMHGQMDISLIPSNFINHLEIQNPTLELGSGQISGAININTQFNHPGKFILSNGIQLGSFGQVSLIGNNLYKIKKVKLNSDFNIERGNNNYPYKFGSQDYNLLNAEYQQFHFKQGVSFPIKNNTYLNAHVWLYQLDRAIPPIAGILNPPRKDKQLDQGIRSMLNIKNYNKLFDLDFKSAFSKEVIEYNEFDNDLSSFKNRLDLKFKIAKKLSFGLYNRYNFLLATSDNYDGKKERQHYGLSGLMNYNPNPMIDIVGGLMKEWANDQKELPFNKSLKLAVHDQAKSKIIQISYSENFRIPSLNDLHWVPGGNENLKVENSHQFNLDLNFSTNIDKKENSKTEVKAELSAYHNRITNYIEWKPGTTQIWSPSNLSKVNVSGFNSQIYYGIRNQNIKYGFELSYSFTDSRKKSRNSSLDNSYNKQLIYIPKNKISFSSLFGFKTWSLELSCLYTSKRFISSDNLQSLSPYFIGDIRIGKLLRLKNNAFNIDFMLNNWWNTSYVSIAERPMPGRNFQIGLKHNIFKN